MDDNDEGDWVMGTNASEDGAHRAAATARERNSMVECASFDIIIDFDGVAYWY